MDLHAPACCKGHTTGGGDESGTKFSGISRTKLRDAPESHVGTRDLIAFRERLESSRDMPAANCDVNMSKENETNCKDERLTRSPQPVSRDLPTAVPSPEHKGSRVTEKRPSSRRSKDRS